MNRQSFIIVNARIGFYLTGLRRKVYMQKTIRKEPAN